ncbi:MAG TPA: phosphoenolpyruvate--protein phosphotransferase [Alphaproteobacteria bacterium]|nr:phosphoenolpyruvate--protein phosphotransferase [Alphaproteobacteria bacterium]HAJ45967.1 phosphoenolpyruvate--protein phosphotransferase [Alphaproteobacteria bacterium]
MAERVSAQSRLDRIVSLIAANMVAEVCSVYLVRPGKQLELFATEGLNKAAVHKTRMKWGEGIVGDVAANARPLNLPDAPSHPSFSYRPETGEDPFQSMLGVPVIRGGQTLGVIAVQNRTHRLYGEEEVEALQTIAMVLAEMVLSGQLIDPAELDGGDRKDKPWRASGINFSEGMAMGRAVLHEPRVKIEKLIADDPVAERARLDKAIEDLREQIDAMLAQEDSVIAGETRDVLEAYRMFANDRGWLNRLREAVNSGLTAEAAVERVQEDTRARMHRQTDSLIKERLHDLEDLANRLLRHLAGRADTAAEEQLPLDAIVFARHMGPAELLDYDRTRLKGLILEEGSPTSHVAIVARALDIPLIGRIEGVLDQVEPLDWVIVDGETGDLHLRPTSDVREAYRHKLALRAQRQAAYAAIRDVPAMTRDGVKVRLQMNAGLLADLPHLSETGAEGIGLFRTELQFMIAPSMPRLQHLVDLYTQVLDAAGDLPVVFRTLDLGGDKVLPYARPLGEENPAMGWRAIRMTLDRPALLRYQIRALLAAGAGRDLSIMFPMVAEVAEYMTARGLVEKELERLDKRREPRPRSLRLGTMLEVPALVFQLEALTKAVDFISIGSNDLMQFLFASDRGNPRLGNRYDTLSPPMLNLIKQVVDVSAARGVPVTVCGEMAGRPLEAMALIGLGIRSLSMPPASIGPVKQMILSMNSSALAAALTEMRQNTGHSVRSALKTLAQLHNLSI